MFTLNNRILILAPHTDDGEFGCGGAIARFIESGSEVLYVAFSSCKTSTPPGFPPGILEEEVKVATSLLGVQKLKLFDYDVRYFSYKRQEILEDMVNLNREFQPGLVFTPASTDLHQDHQVIHNESKRAFKHANMLGFELPWNNIVMTTHAFIRLGDPHLNQKIESISRYNSQKFRPYYAEEFIRSLAITRGTQAGSRYAEAFEVIRMIM